MTTAAMDSSPAKTKSQALFEYVLLAVCLCVIALRTTITESPTVQSTTLPSNVGDIAYSLWVSAVLIFALVLWFVVSFLSSRLTYRFAGIEPGLALFAVAATAGGLAAADKRLAITDVAMVLAAVSATVLLVQILDSPAKIMLVLAVIAALGVVCTYQCAEQLLISNQLTIEQYDQSPQTILEPMGIEPGSLQQFLLEHRLYSGSVRGFFTTRNSAGSFALLACFAAVALFIEKLKNRKFDASWPAHLLSCGIAAAVILFGFALIRSKGAIIGSLLGAAIFVVLLRFGDWVRLHRKAILIVCLSMGIAAVGAITWYGLGHGRLPGGNPMLVRWQYWQASAKMVADFPLTGAGPGNFSQYYTYYKPAEALESVGDPHNFVLRVLTEYGPLGLVGFLAMVLVPLWKTISPVGVTSAPKTARGQPPFRILAIAFLVVTSAALLLIRPMITLVPPTDSVEATVYVIVTLHVLPTLAFALGFFFLTTPSRSLSDQQYAMPDMNAVRSILFCAVIGLLVHNLIDFAIFEPGVFTTFWAVLACLIAADSLQTGRPHFVAQPARPAKIAMAIAAAVVLLCYLNYALVPVTASTRKIQQANQAISDGWFERAHYLLDKAAEDDPLSPTPLSLNGRLYLHDFQMSGGRDKDLLLNAQECFHAAIRRNRQNFKSFEQLAEVYAQFAEITTQHEKTGYLNKALDTFRLAVERYRGCDRLRFKLAKVAEQLGKTDVAIEQYKEAVRIEDSYRAQFRIMYPERKEIISRLGQDNYQFALKRIEELTEKSGIQPPL